MFKIFLFICLALNVSFANTAWSASESMATDSVRSTTDSGHSQKQQVIKI